MYVNQFAACASETFLEENHSLRVGEAPHAFGAHLATKLGSAGERGLRARTARSLVLYKFAEKDQCNIVLNSRSTRGVHARAHLVRTTRDEGVDLLRTP